MGMWMARNTETEARVGPFARTADAERWIGKTRTPSAWVVVPMSGVAARPRFVAYVNGAETSTHTTHEGVVEALNLSRLAGLEDECFEFVDNDCGVLYRGGQWNAIRGEFQTWYEPMDSEDEE